MDKELRLRIEKNIKVKEIISLIENLVASPSYSGIENQETETAKKIYDFFKKENIEAEMIPVTDGRCNIIARLKGNGKGKALLLTGHTDTVHPYNMEDPFKIKTLDGKIFGRGVVDMKGALSCMMISMAALKKAGAVLQGDLIFAGVIDEEDSSLGTRALISSGFSADGVIIGEPTNMEVCTCHRGVEWLEFIFHGKSVHSSQKEKGINAIQKAVKFISKLEEDLEPALKKRRHALIGPSLMNYGFINGGAQPGIVAGECVLRMDRRWLPQEKHEMVMGEFQKIMDEIKEKDPQFHADFIPMGEGDVNEAMETDINEPIVKASLRVISEETGQEHFPNAFPAWSDGGLFCGIGKMPSVILGPGSIDCAHSDNEHIEMAVLEQAALYYALIAFEYCK